jgi:hypothetical protein
LVETQVGLQAERRRLIIHIMILKAIQIQIGMKGKRRKSWEMDAVMGRIVKKIMACENEFTPFLGAN